MSLSTDNQLTLLRDLLSEHCEDCCGSKSELQQIARLARLMLSKKTVDQQDILDLLPGVYRYSTEAEQSPDVSAHIEQNREELQGWVNTIDNHFH